MKGAAGVADPAAGTSPFARSEAGAWEALFEGTSTAPWSASPEGPAALPDAAAAAEAPPKSKDGAEAAPNENGADEPRPPKAGVVAFVPKDGPDPGAAEEAPNEKRDVAADDAGGAPKLKGAFEGAAP